MITDVNNVDMESDECVITHITFMAAWVCGLKSWSKEEMEERGRKALPKFSSSIEWRIIEKEDEDPELESPGLCAEAPELRQHWLFGLFIEERETFISDLAEVMTNYIDYITERPYLATEQERTVH
jgi:hypothetical protein